ncbi:MAG: hypothetical protein ABJE47_07840 [bacterium]
MRRSLCVVLLVLASTGARAQIVRSRFQLQEPAAWVSGGIGYQDPWTVLDGTTGSRWQFGNSTPYAASIEKSVASGTTLGIRGNTGSVPMTYVGVASTADADATVSQLFATLHVASGREFHTVLELSAGATIYSSFKARGTGDKLPPQVPDNDFAFAFGYGIGYALSPRFSVDVIQDVTTSLHQHVGLAAGDDTSARWRTTRVVARLGLGGR